MDSDESKYSADELRRWKEKAEASAEVSVSAERKDRERRSEELSEAISSGIGCAVAVGAITGIWFFGGWKLLLVLALSLLGLLIVSAGLAWLIQRHEKKGGLVLVFVPATTWLVVYFVQNDITSATASATIAVAVVYMYLHVR